MVRPLFALVSAVLIGACASPDNSAWSPRQRALAHRIRQTRSLSGWIASTDTVVLRLPDSVRVDVLPRVVATPHDFLLCNAIGRSVVRISREGRFKGKFGRTGSGPGEFRSIIAAGTDTLGRLYVFDNLLARITCFNADGTLLTTIPVRSPFLVRHLCPAGPGMIYLHHAPDSAGGGFVTLTGPDGRETALIASPPEYQAYYFRGHLEGALIPGGDGAVFETNSYSPAIRRIQGAEVSRSFGESFGGFTPLPASRGFSTIHELQNAVMSATLVKGLFLVGNGELLLQELVRFSRPARSIDRRMLVYDTSGVYLGELTGDAGGIETSDGDALVQVYNPFPPPGRRSESLRARLPRIVVLHLGGYDHE